MQRTAIQSSNLKAIGWENIAGVGTLEVEFHNGAIYRYWSVPEHYFETLLNPMPGTSAGAYFNLFIKDLFDCQRVAHDGSVLVADSGWMREFDERQKMTIRFARMYAREFGHGADGHNNMLVIAKLADLLDASGGGTEPTPQRLNEKKQAI